MAVDIPKTNYTGSIKEIGIGDGDKALKVGGETAYSFHNFEGAMPNAPRIGLEVNDVAPDAWPAALAEQYQDVWDDPAAWAKKCVETFGADFIHLQLVGTDPNGLNRSPEEAVQAAVAVAGAVDVPLCIWGTANVEKDTAVLRAVAEKLADRNLMLGPIQEENHKQLGAMVLGYNHTAIASSPIDINLAKQLNILLGNLGVSDQRILIDPTVGGLGYGLEYTYSVMERARMAALSQQDEKLQFPLYCNIGSEVWKTKETRLDGDDDSLLGDPSKRGILMESTTASSLLLAGADLLVLRHPKSLELIRGIINKLS